MSSPADEIGGVAAHLLAVQNVQRFSVAGSGKLARWNGSAARRNDRRDKRPIMYWRRGSIGSAIMGALLIAAAARADEPQQRILHFPPDRSVGVVYTRPARQGSYRDSLYTDDWQRIGEAR